MWTVTFSVLSVLSCLGSLLAIYLAVRSAALGRALLRRFESFKTLDAKLLDARLLELEQTISLVANRVKMTRVRNNATHAERDKGGEPDARSDPEAWRAWKNAQLRAGVFNQ